jgi:hypothetical protein
MSRVRKDITSVPDALTSRRQLRANDQRGRLDALAQAHTYDVLQRSGGQIVSDPLFPGIVSLIMTLPAEAVSVDDMTFTITRTPQTSVFAHYHRTLEPEDIDTVSLKGAMERDTKGELGCHTDEWYWGYGIQTYEDMNLDADDRFSRGFAVSYDFTLLYLEPNTTLTVSGWQFANRMITSNWSHFAAFIWGNYAPITTFDTAQALPANDPLNNNTNDTWAYYGVQAGAWCNGSSDALWLEETRNFFPALRNKWEYVTNNNGESAFGTSMEAQVHNDKYIYEAPTSQRFYAWSRVLGTSFPYRNEPEE